MAIDASNSVEIHKFEHTMTVGEPLIIRADVTVTNGRSNRRENVAFNLGKIESLKHEGIQVRGHINGGRSRESMVRMIPWKDLDSGAVVRKLVSNG